MLREKVLLSYLGLQQGEQSAAEQSLSVEGRAKMVRVVSTGGHISDPKKSTKGVLPHG